MANNIVGGAPNAIVAKATVAFSAAGITSTNTEIIYLVGNPLKSYVPGRPINGISGFESGKGYYMVAKQDMDLTSHVVPPVTGGSSTLSAPGSFTATPISATQINLTWNASPNATGYTVDRATNSGFTTGVTLGIYSGNGTSYNNTGLTASTQYYYRIRATAAGYTDSGYSTTNATTQAVGAVTEDLTFPTQVNLSNTGTTWTSTSAAAFYDGYGLSNKKLAAGQNGWIQTRRVAADATAGVLGFNTTATNQKYQTPPGTGATHYEAGAFINAGALYYMDNGATSAVNSGTTLAIGDYFRINRTGSQLKLQKSTNGTTWTDVYTYTFSSAADLFININVDTNTGANKLYEPKGNNVSNV